MPKHPLRYSLAAVLVPMFTVSAFAADDRPDASSKQAGQELHAKMAESGDKMKSMPMTGDLDHDFIMGMREHHKDAVEMSKVASKGLRDPKARQFAQRFIDAQTKELAELDAWLAKHPAQPAP